MTNINEVLAKNFEIEALAQDTHHEASCGKHTWIEHDDKDYNLVGCRNVSLNGLTVRVREVR